MFTIDDIYLVRENDGTWRAFTAAGLDLGTFRTVAEAVAR